MMRMTLIVAGAVIPFSLAQGQFVLTEDNRSLSANVEIELTDPDDGVTMHFFEDFDSASPSEPFGVFEATAFARAEGMVPHSQWGQSLVVQTSDANETSLSGEGSVFSEGLLGFAIPPSFMTVNGSSEYSVRFDVAEPTLVRMRADLQVESPSQGSGTYGLARARIKHFVDGDPVAPVLIFAVLGTGAELIDETVLLEPGNYSQEFSAQASLATQSGAVGPSSASFSGSLTFLGSPCNAADVSEPFGVLDLADVQSFVTAFVNQEPAADLAEPFGVYDLVDVLEFVTAFLGGCP